MCQNRTSILTHPAFVFKPSFRKCSPFALQNESFCKSKGVLLHIKTNPFSVEKESFCEAIAIEGFNSTTKNLEGKKIFSYFAEQSAPYT